MNNDPFSLLDRSYRDSYTSNESDYHFFNDSENDHINDIKDYRWYWFKGILSSSKLFRFFCKKICGKENSINVE